MKARFAQTILPVNLALGLILPWATALAVRAWLAHLGQPVMSWPQIRGYLPLFTIYLAPPFMAPFLLCGLWARWLLRRGQLRHPVATTGAIIGATSVLSLATIWLHWTWWRDISEPEVFIVIPIVVFCISVAVATIGGIAGYVIGRLIERRARAGST